MLRLTPGRLGRRSRGPRGSQTQVRIRGAEANHTLLFVDGIRFNDPAAGNEPRFELLTNDGVDRIDVMRGPQSALWGSEAIGGVVDVYTNGARSQASASSALAEYGSLDSARASARASATAGRLELGGAGRLADERRHRLVRRGRRPGRLREPSAEPEGRRSGRPPTIEIGAVGHWIEAESEFDGFDPVTFRRADTLDETRNRIAAVRGCGREVGQRTAGPAKLDASLLASANRNRLAGAPLNSTFGRRAARSARSCRGSWAATA